MDTVVKRRVWPLLAVSPLLLYSTYLALRRAGLAWLYRPAPLGDCQFVPDLNYCSDCHGQKHRLDLFLPPKRDYPLFIFVHGGALVSGDKCLRVCGADVYGNIGRFYASQGIGVALINYRLQPHVTWREQVDDVARATAWMYTHAHQYGGDSSRLFIGGHSAGAQLAARVGLDANALGQHGLSPAILKGVVAVSGAALDLTDQKTYDLGGNYHRYEGCFRCGDPTDNWKRKASPMNYITPGAPPFLVMYAQGETKELQRQSDLLHAALRQKGVPSELVVIPGENHCRIVLALSRMDKLAAPAILGFIRRTNTVSLESQAPCLA